MCPEVHLIRTSICGKLGHWSPSNEPPDAHVDLMANRPSVRLLDVDVTALEPTLWKWAISDKNFEVSHGYATSRETAQFEGNDALFALLLIVRPTR